MRGVPRAAQVRRRRAANAGGKWAYFFREAGKLTTIPEALSYPPVRDALEVARTARFTVDEWDAYIRAGMAIQNERGALSLARKEGRAEGRADGIRVAIEALCEAFGIELSSERKRELQTLDAAGLTELLTRLRAQKRWP